MFFCAVGASSRVVDAIEVMRHDGRTVALTLNVPALVPENANGLNPPAASKWNKHHNPA